MRSKEIVAYAPYPVHLYRELLIDVLDDHRARILPFTRTGYFYPDKANLFVRHDIDTADCIRNMHLLLDVDRELGIPSGVYFRADEAEYRPSDYCEEIRSYRADIFEVGLHTLCYLQDDYMTEFQRETELFTRSLGFNPRSFTVHGMGVHRIDVRMRFCEEICRRMGEFGYLFSDCCPKQRIYDYTIEDCHWSEEKKSHYLCDDFLRVPDSYKANNYILLTHPRYWKKGQR